MIVRGGLIIAACAVAARVAALDSIVTFNEIHYHPSTSNGVEFIELHNQNSVDVELSGWRISGGVDFTFPAGTVVSGRGYLVIAADPAAVPGALGPFVGRLDNQGEKLRLRNHNNRVMDEVEYNDRDPWPLGADGAGGSLAKIDPLSAGTLPRNWHHSRAMGGTPGADNFPSGLPSDPYINELAGGEGGFFIELLNPADTPLDLGGYVIRSEAGDTLTIGAGLTAPARGVALLNEATLGFAVERTDSVSLYAPDQSALLDTARVGAAGQARVDGVWFATGGAYAASPGALNPPPAKSDVVINEIMYHHRPTYADAGDAPKVELSELLPWNAVWRYNESGTDLGANWALASHSGWASGPGPLGYEPSAGLPPVPIATPLNDPAGNSPYVLTYYFETEFSVDAATLASNEQFVVYHQVDDGAVFYINGVEVGRYDMPAGAVDASTTAANTSSEADAVRQLLLSDPPMVAGSNRLSIEVHQVNSSSSDVVMGAKVEARRVDPAPQTPVEYAENDTEWIELYNRGAAAVDLSGWSLVGAVRHTFPVGTSIRSDGYLVVDAFGGSLANGGEELLLLDAEGNRADEVFYRDDAPWPAAADGGGSSLELRDPRMDNSAPEAWRASDNAAASEWVEYSFTMTAEMPVFTPAIYDFNELRVGLLSAGEVLLDDVSVVEDPDGAAIELITNGAFDSLAGWRLLGTHMDSVRVVDDGNPALKVIAVNRMSYLNNVIESNLSRPVQVGAAYRVSFRAKWLSGSPQLRFELYYNRLAKTVVLEQPVLHGTPGAVNTAHENNAGPVFHDLRHTPAVPSAGQAVEVALAATDPDGIASLALRYAVNEGAFVSVPMGYSAVDETWRATIPGQSNGTLVQFYVQGADAVGKMAYAPAAGPDSRAIIEWSPSTADNGDQSIRLNMLASEAAALHDPDDLLSNHRFGCTVIVNEDRVAYDAGIRLRGSMWSRRYADGGGLNVKFPADKRFRGIHSTITLRKRDLEEILAKHIITQAGGLHESYNDIVYQYGHTAAMDGWSRLEVARFGSDYLEGLPVNNAVEGTMFKMEGIRELQDTQDGTPNTPKTPFPAGWVGWFDLADQGDNKEMYRHNLPISSHRDRDDFSAMINLCKTLSLDGQALEDAAPAVMDVDMWTRQFALMSLCGVSDIYSQGQSHNLNFYVRPDDGIIEPMPWDWDHPFEHSTSMSLIGSGNIAKVFNRPVFTRLYQGHLLELIETTYNTAYLTTWFDHYGSWARQNYDAYLDYVANRGAFVLSRLPASVPFAITSNSGADFSVATPTVVLAGSGWIDVREIRAHGAPVPVEWTSADEWRVELPVAPGANAIELRAYNYAGAEVGSDSITVTGSGEVEVASSSNLVISEIHYNPLGPTTAAEIALAGLEDDDFEFIELMNTHPSAYVNLLGCRFAAGVSYDFGARLLAPGERVLVVANEAAMAARYGEGLDVLGVFNGKLSNGGEWLTLLDAAGGVIASLHYGTGGLWAAAADGVGCSLVLRNAAAMDRAEGWEASQRVGGTPGAGPSAGAETRGVVINEVLTHTDPPLKDSVELFNAGSETVDLGGWYLSDSAGTPLKFKIPAATFLPPGAYAVFDEDDFNPTPLDPRPEDFAFDGAHGDEVYLAIPNADESAPDYIVDRVDFGAAFNGESFGRYPNATGWVTPMRARTFGAYNAFPRYGPMLITELCNPTNALDLAFLELLNMGTNTIDLTDWRIRGEVDFDFEDHSTLDPGGVVVVLSFDPDDPANAPRLAAWRARYAVGQEVGLVGGFAGTFHPAQGRVRVERPDAPPMEEPTYTPHVVEDEGLYRSSTAGGQALHRLASERFGHTALGWGAGEPSPGTVVFVPPSKVDVVVGPSIDPASIRLSWGPSTGAVYSVYHSLDLNAWSRLATTNGAATATSIEVRTDEPHEFYKLIEHP